ncbi:MAG: hypothetical protein JSS86_09755 [Cyanobacteria bacterium SZAS LIN-2]|nr:hypothetical protein [Cyanobacteria bacterium SZAS LIN-2]
MASKSSVSTLYLYLHTHWDREWYWSFAGYRTQLVSVVKNILHLLESGALDKFMLDGQTALIEDVLEVSPGLGPRIKSLVKAGKLSIGPWYVLADQMLVGGESLLRNLQYGLQLSQQFGGATMVGYCPDTFGHTADLPRILRGWGIDTAVVWRGVPSISDSPLFDWRSPDGSEVLTLDLTQGYYQSAFGEHLDASALANSLAAFLELEIDKSGQLVEKSSTVPTLVAQVKGALVPVGADHVGPPATYKEQLKAALAALNKAASADTKVAAETISLAEFFKKVRSARTGTASDEPMALIDSELRDNKNAFSFARAYMLDGVLSTRLYLKRDNRLSEYKMLRRLEPFRALLARHKILPYCAEEIDFNWKLLLKNQPHDSICGCSIDSVHREMQSRTASFNDSCDLLIAQGKEAILKSVLTANNAPSDLEVRFGARHLDVIEPNLSLDRLLVFNPHTSPYAGPVRLRLALPQNGSANVESRLPRGFQTISSHQASETFLGLSQVPTFKDVTVFDGYLDAGLIPGATLQPFSLDEKAGGKDTDASVRDDAQSFGSVKVSNQFFTLKFDNDGSLIAQVTNEDGKGFTTFKLGHKLVDVADAGDSYNFDPIANDEPLVAKLVSVAPGKKGPLVSSLVAHYQIDLPEGLVARGSHGKAGEAEDAPHLTVFERARIRVPHKIETEITLKKDVPVVFFETTMQHHVADHRLEVVFSLPEAVDHTLSENHYSLIKRYHDKKAALNPLVPQAELVDLGHEAPLRRYPCQRFFVAGRSTFMNLGLPEYGVGDSSVSITLLRAVSYLSRKRLRTRGGGAGPIMPTPEANCPGLMRASYGWAPTDIAPYLAGHRVSLEAAPYVLADIFEGEPLAFLSPAGGVADKSLSLFAVDHPDIQVTATFIDASQRLVIRLLNPTSENRSVRLALPGGAKNVTLADFDGKTNGRKLPLSQSAVSLEFKPCQLLTVFCES